MTMWRRPRRRLTASAWLCAAPLLTLPMTACGVTPSQPDTAPLPPTASDTGSAPAPPAAVVHEETRVTSWRLPNGVRAHHRASLAGDGQATITLSFAGGVLEETAETRGVSDVAASVITALSVQGSTPREIRARLDAADVSIEARTGLDVVRITIRGPVASLDTGLDVALRLLLRARVTEEACQIGRDRLARLHVQTQSLALPALLSFSVAQRSAAEDVRLRPVTPEQARTVTPDMVRGWLDRLAREAPLEVAIVGDLPAARAGVLLSRRLAALPARPEPSPEARRAWRSIEPVPGPALTVHRVRTDAALGLAEMSYDVPTDAESLVALRVASELWRSRLARDAGFASGATVMRVVVDAGEASPALAALRAIASADTLNPVQVAAMMQAHAESLAKGPIDEAEFLAARGAAMSAAREALTDDDAWLGALGTLELDGRTLDELVAEPARLESVTLDAVARVLSQVVRPEGRRAVVIRAVPTLPQQPEPAPR